jgi:hypothetical protein
MRLQGSYNKSLEAASGMKLDNNAKDWQIQEPSRNEHV